MQVPKWQNRIQEHSSGWELLISVSPSPRSISLKRRIKWEMEKCPIAQQFGHIRKKVFHCWRAGWCPGCQECSRTAFHVHSQAPHLCYIQGTRRAHPRSTHPWAATEQSFPCLGKHLRSALHLAELIHYQRASRQTLSSWATEESSTHLSLAKRYPLCSARVAAFLKCFLIKQAFQGQGFFLTFFRHWENENPLENIQYGALFNSRYPRPHFAGIRCDGAHTLCRGTSSNAAVMGRTGWHAQTQGGCFIWTTA